MPPNGRMTSLLAIGSKPLDEITPDEASDVARQVLKNDADDAVDVARFGSII